MKDKKFTLLSLLLSLSVTMPVGAQDTVSDNIFVKKDAELRQLLQSTDAVVEVEDATTPVIDTVPHDMLNENARFFTISSENDFFGNGTDKDYTNGLRLTYMDMGAKQPFFVEWLDTISPTFDVNKTTTSYFSFGQNLYTPQDITVSTLNKDDRPYAAFTYFSGGLSTATDNHIDNAELTLGWVGPLAGGKAVQTEYHKLIGADKPMGWSHQLDNELGLILSLERQWPQRLSLRLRNQRRLRFVPHVGLSLGNIYTYANAGFTLSYTPDDDSFQAQPVRVRPAMPGSGFFIPGKNKWSWMAYVGLDGRLVARNIFLDGNTFTKSHSVDKKYVVLDATAGLTFNYDAFRIGYSLNWRSKEFDSPLAKEQVFGAVTASYRY